MLVNRDHISENDCNILRSLLGKKLNVFAHKTEIDVGMIFVEELKFFENDKNYTSLFGSITDTEKTGIDYFIFNMSNKKGTVSDTDTKIIFDTNLPIDSIHILEGYETDDTLFASVEKFEECIFYDAALIFQLGGFQSVKIGFDHGLFGRLTLEYIDNANLFNRLAEAKVRLSLYSSESTRH